MGNGARPVKTITELRGARGAKWRKIVFMILATLCLIGIGVNVIVNLAVSGAITWSLYPILGNAFAIALLTPLLANKNSAAIWLASISVFTLPFLFFMDAVTPGISWFIGLSLPIYAISIVAMWIFYFTAKRANNKWFAAAFIVFISCVIISPAIDLLVFNFTSQFAAVHIIYTYINIISTAVIGIVVSAILLGIGMKRKHKIRHEHNPLAN